MINCPSCAAPLVFDIESQKMHCEYCENYYDVKNIRDSEKDDAKSTQMYDTYVYVCPSCGAELITTDKNDAIGFCPYCGGASMMFDKVREQWKPKKVIPFKITKEQCKDFYSKEVKKRFFVSNKYKNPSLIEGFRGIYMPYWACDTEHKGKYTVKVKSKEKNIGHNDYQTDYYDASGDIDLQLKGYSHDASVAFDDNMSENISPFDISQQEEFHPGYLSGFYGEIGDADSKDYMKRSTYEISEYIEKTVESDNEINQNIKSQKLERDKSKTTVPTKIKKVTTTMYPVWFMSYRNKDKITYAAVNGQTGKVCADLPLSPFKILLTALIISCVIFTGAFLLKNNLPSLPAATTLGVCSVIALSGAYYILRAYVETIASALKNKELMGITGMGAFFFICAVLAALGIIMYTTDGSYAQNRAFYGQILAPAGLLGILGSFISRGRNVSKINKTIKAESDSSLRNGIIAESKRSSKYMSIVQWIIIITSAVSMALLITNVTNRYLLYGLCFLFALELFIYALLNIRFQSDVAKRAIPQFNKKGAYYDDKA